jgi:hypothetical protein
MNRGSASARRRPAVRSLALAPTAGDDHRRRLVTIARCCGQTQTSVTPKARVGSIPTSSTDVVSNYGLILSFLSQHWLGRAAPGGRQSIASTATERG